MMSNSNLESSKGKKNKAISKNGFSSRDKQNAQLK